MSAQSAATGLKFRPAPMAPKADPLRAALARSGAARHARLTAVYGGYSPLATVPDVPPDFDGQAALGQAVADQAAADDLAGRNGRPARSRAVRDKLWANRRT